MSKRMTKQLFPQDAAKAALEGDASLDDGTKKSQPNPIKNKPAEETISKDTAAKEKSSAKETEKEPAKGSESKEKELKEDSAISQPVQYARRLTLFFLLLSSVAVVIVGVFISYLAYDNK
jgi:hypothetical protein